MKKHLLKVLFLATMIIGLSMTAFGQKKGEKKPRKPKNSPKIIVPKKSNPPKKKKKKKKKKKDNYSKFIRSNINSKLS